MSNERRSLLLALALLAPARPGSASTPRSAQGDPIRAAQGASWPAPLSRPISFHAREISLREALDGLAAAARVRLSYSNESLILDRSLNLSVDSVPLGDALVYVLGGAPVQLVVLAADHVVLAPRDEAGVAERRPIVLDRIVVTGSAAGAARRPLPVALDVLDGRELADQSVTSVAQALNGGVPGLWVWEQSPVSVLATYGSIRGASSFGLSYPKVYIDGIQVANPLLVTRLTPDAIERVEVIRGPQGAALYGADAISGVTNIVTRHEVADTAAPHARVHGSLGLSASDYASDPTLGQDHTLTLLTGSNTRSAGLTLEIGTVGAYVPNVYARHVAASGNARRVGSASLVTGTLRFFKQQTRTAVSPLITGLLADSATGRLPPNLAGPGVQSAAAYTAGMTAKLTPNDRWLHSLTVGVDGYTLDGVWDDHTPIPTADATALRDARGAGLRGTIRASSVVRLGLGSLGFTDLTVALEPSALRQRTTQVVTQGVRMPSDTGEVVTWRGNTGLMGRINATLWHRLFLTAGGRIERDQFAGAGRYATLPALGGAWVIERGPLTLKLRGAYGEGLRWPETPARDLLWQGMHTRARNVSLDPERQSGIEGGLDLMLGQVVMVQLTRFDQTASGLIQRVAVQLDTAAAPQPGAPRIAYEWQNVGEIDNQGWELEGSVRRGPLSLGGTFSQVDSRVRALAAGYGGDLQPGDRMLEVPERTVSARISWSAWRWSTSLTAYRAMNWINYDRLALAQAFAAGTRPTRDFIGTQLRSYWVEYPGVTHLRATASLSLLRDVRFTAIGDNLLNRQTGEPDNVTVLPGRTIALGVRAAF
ncbi:MAG: TonB-dependent receptor [Gemmatimonadetes bacterium]|nr:TonB-dependent receptor [Gemmatimonadota bacterium]